MDITKQVKPKKSGFAIMLVLLALVVLSLVGVGLLSLGMNRRIAAIRSSDEIEARCAADAGLIKALYEINEQLRADTMNNDALPEVINEALPNCNSVFSYTVAGDLDSGYTINSVGNSSLAQKNVSCTLQLEGPFEFAIFANEQIDLKNGATVDWYNYDADDGNLKVGTNSTGSDKIELKNGSVVNGDINVGVGGDPDVVIKNTGGTIVGEASALPRRNYLPPVTVPQWVEDLPYSGDVENSTTITSSGKYGSIDLGNSDVITIDGSVTLYVTDDITLDNSAELQIAGTNPDAYLVLYLGGNFEGKNGGTINNGTAEPKKLKIFGLNTCEDIRLKNGGVFYGAIYAPDAVVTFDNSTSAYGSVVADSFVQMNSAPFMYDASLREASESDEGVRFVTDRWSGN